MGKYRTKPCEIEAIQWKPDNTDEVIRFCKDRAEHNYTIPRGKIKLAGLLDSIRISNFNEEDIYANIYDYIIRDSKGVYSVCRPNIFEEMYELIEE